DRCPVAHPEPGGRGSALRCARAVAPSDGLEGRGASRGDDSRGQHRRAAVRVGESGRARLRRARSLRRDARPPGPRRVRPRHPLLPRGRTGAPRGACRVRDTRTPHAEPGPRRGAPHLGRLADHARAEAAAPALRADGPDGVPPSDAERESAQANGVWGDRKRAARAEHARALDGPAVSEEGEAEGESARAGRGVWGDRRSAARAEHARAADGPPDSLEEEAETGAAAPPPPAGSLRGVTTEAARTSCRAPSARVTPPRGWLPSTRGESSPSR